MKRSWRGAALSDWPRGILLGSPKANQACPHFDYSALRARIPGAWITNNGYSLVDATASVDSGRIDAVAVGRAFICNPDHVRRWRDGAALNDLRPDLLYGGRSEGGYGLPDAGLTGYITFSHDVVGVLGEEPPRRIPVGAITRPLRLYRRIGAHRWSSL